jgi:seryl-tRNA synthetase
VIDIRLLREKPEEVRAGFARLGASVDLDGVQALDARLRDLKNESQTLQAEQNRLSKEIGRAAAGEEREKAKAAGAALKAKIEALAGALGAAEAALDEKLLELPNLPHPSVPVGKDDSENVVVREEGTKRTFAFTPQPHWDLGTKLDIIDFDRGVKISGSRFYVLKGWGARLQRALITYMLDMHTQKHGYVEIYPPYMVKRECLVGTGNLPKFGENLYRDAEEDFWFIPTAEVPVTNLYRDEIFDAARLPVRHVAFTACFRREQMAAGRDTRGIKRGHQFDKVELVKFVHPDDSMNELTQLLSDAEDILKGLELPYRVVQMCTGDLSFSAMAKFDLELWAPGQNEWLEVSSCSNFGEFQARRAKIRFREAGEKGKNRFVHTLNGSGLALPRTLIGVLETYQRADGRIDVPAVLRPYVGGATVLG